MYMLLLSLLKKKKNHMATVSLTLSKTKCKQHCKSIQIHYVTTLKIGI